MQTPSHESKRASLDEAPDDGLNSFADDFAKVWLEAIDGPDPADLLEDWMWPKATQLPREDWPVGLKSYRFIKKDDPTLEEYSSTSSSKASEQYVPGSPKHSSTGLSKTPEQYEGTHEHGTYKGSWRVTFSSPRQSLVGLEAQANYARARQAPTTIEFLKSNELDSPSFGAVEVQLPFDIEVTQSNCVGKLSSVPHDITDAGLDARKRLVVTNVQGANAKFSKIQRGDIIRAVSVGAHDDSDKPWWSEKPEDIPWGKSVQTEAPAVEDGMVMLDGKGVSTYDAVLLENMRRHLKQEHMMPKTVQFLIERPHQVPDENDPDFFGGLRWPAFWQKSEEATPQTIPTAADLDPREEPVKHIFFDFDKTISRVHVFLVLAGWEESGAPPYALTERGQISKMRQLNSAGPYWSYNEKFGGIVPTNCNGERWTQAALGGGARIKVLRKLFADLRDQGVVMTIITKGYVGAVRTLLTEEGLIDNFDMVIGNIANSYGTNEYDLLQEERSKLEGSADDKLKVQKNEFIWTLMQREGLAPSQVVLVEDDPNEIASLGNPLICETVYVRQQQGMMAAEFDELRRLAKVPGPKEERPATKPIMPEEHFPIAKVPAPEPALAVEAAAETSAKAHSVHGAAARAVRNAGNVAGKVAACAEK
jgi:FMN phosphatase YigB (HAD superfamily)